jgi:hypothetical protein
MARVSERFVSHGHGDAFDAVVWANEPGRAALDSATDAPDGAVFVEDALRAVPGGEVQAGRLGMERRGGEWRFFAVEPDADASAVTPPASACASCHRDAPRDFVFPLPPSRAPAPQTHSAASSAAITATAPTAVAIPAATYDASSAGAAASPSR